MHDAPPDEIPISTYYDTVYDEIFRIRACIILYHLMRIIMQ
jgi:hypothetical protein